jgi:hypothetical protein
MPAAASTSLWYHTPESQALIGTPVQAAVFRADNAQDAVIEGVFPYRLNCFSDCVTIQKLFFIHHFCIVMADLNHFRQRAGSRQRNHLGVVGILFYRYLFYRDARFSFSNFSISFVITA